MPSTVIGLDTFVRTLNRAADDLARLDAANAHTAAIVATAAVARAPRKTGALAASISGRPVSNGADITATIRYAGYVHNGAPRRHMTARPFITQAVDATRPQWENAYAQNVAAITGKVRGA